MTTALKNESKRVPEFAVYSLLKSETVVVRETYCQGTCRHLCAEECTTSTQLVFPYRGVYVRHLGEDQAVADANQVLFFNAHEGYQISHPVAGGDASLTLVISEPQLRELAPRAFLRGGTKLVFRRQRLRIDAPAQALVALLRHSLPMSWDWGNFGGREPGTHVGTARARAAHQPRGGREFWKTTLSGSGQTRASR